MSSLRTVAEYLGLSITTVSRALDGYPDVSESTRERVRQAARNLNYAPNAAARRLRRGRSDMIALIMPPPEPYPFPPFYIDLIFAIASALSKLGRELTIIPSTQESEEQLYRRLVESRSSDGVIILRPQIDDPRIAFLNTHNFPFAAFGPAPPGMRCDNVDPDNVDGLSRLTRRAWELGHKRIAMLAAPSHWTGSAEREAGFTATMRELGLEPLIIHAGVTELDGHAGANRALELDPHPTALLCAGDRLASGAYRALKERNLTPGREVSVTGMTNLSWTAYFNPPLTTLDWQLESAGRELAEAIVALIDKKAEPGTICRRLPMQLIERASLGPPVAA